MESVLYNKTIHYVCFAGFRKPPLFLGGQWLTCFKMTIHCTNLGQCVVDADLLGCGLTGSAMAAWHLFFCVAQHFTKGLVLVGVSM